MRYLFFIGIAAILFSCNSSKKDNKEVQDMVAIKQEIIKTEELPSYAKLDGTKKSAWTWTDKNGTNYLLFSETGIVSNEDHSSAKIMVGHWSESKGDHQLLQRSEAEVDSCEFDVTLAFIKESISVTDLDKDGTAEVSFMYRKACRSDVSPAELVFIMNEGKDRYVLGGLSWIQSSQDDSLTVTEDNANLETLPGYDKTGDEYMKTFGRYESEITFIESPPEFLPYARKQWIKFVKENFE
jgi:hypothetical protein